MTSIEVEQAAKSGAVVLWPISVIEQHSSFLPTGSDIYHSSELSRRIAAKLKDRGIESVILPNFFWGVNDVNGAYPGSIEVRPEIVVDLISDVLRSLKRQGFERVFCTSGHGDAAHNKAIYDGVSKARLNSGVDASFLTSLGLAKRLKLEPEDVALTLFDVPRAGPTSEYADVHAGRHETSAILAIAPDLVRQDQLPSLKPSNFGPEDLAEWRKGQEATVRKAPLGYVGDPASANASEGWDMFEEVSTVAAEAVAKRVKT
jgi:creatinine amidohydrolase